MERRLVYLIQEYKQVAEYPDDIFLVYIVAIDRLWRSLTLPVPTVNQLDTYEMCGTPTSLGTLPASSHSSWNGMTFSSK